MKKFLILAVMVVLALGFSSVPALATGFLDFDLAAPTPGSFSYDGGATPLVGTDIGVDSVVGIGTPKNDGVKLAFTDNAGNPIHGLLNFTTGNSTGFDANLWKFGGGGSISLTGGIFALGLPVGTNIFTGDFVDSFVSFNPSSDPTHRVWFDAFNDTKNTTLTDFYGITVTPVNAFVGAVNVGFISVGGDPPPAPFTSSQVLSGDITNTPIPEPATMLLVGSGLIGLAGYWRKKILKR